MKGSSNLDTIDPLSTEGWDAEDSGFMQSRFWAHFKSATGWKARAFRQGTSSRGILVLEKALALGLRFAYVPFGPETLPNGVEAGAFLTALARTVAKASGKGLVFLRFDLPWEKQGGAENSIDHLADLPRGTPVQVPDTLILDLKPGLDELLVGMKPKWRYNIKLAEKKGVVVSREGVESLGSFYALYEETATRDGIAIHPRAYYEALFKTFQEFQGLGCSPRDREDDLSLWVARQGAEAIASIITIFHKGHATYLYGASSGEKRNLMPTYALQWSAIKAAKEAGCVDYDFFGIPPDDDPKHPMAGLYLFKTGFGGKIVHRVGAVDIPLRPVLYFGFRAMESARLSWYKGFKKTLARMRRGSASSQRKTLPSKA